MDTTFLRFPSALRRVLATGGLRVRGTLSAGYSGELDCTVAALPYSDSQLQLVLLLPGTAGRFNADGLSQLESRLSPAAWSRLLRAAAPQQLELTLPIISHRTEAELRPLLGRLGVRAALAQGQADFSGVNGLRDLWLGGLLHATEFHLGDGSVLHAGHAGHGDHSDHGDHGSHGDHGDHGNHGDHGDHGEHGSHGDHGHHGDHGDHGDHAAHSDHGHHPDNHANHIDHGSHDSHGDHGTHDSHGDHDSHDSHGDHDSHDSDGEHGEHHGAPAEEDDSLFPSLPSPSFSDRAGRAQWAVGPQKLSWEEHGSRPPQPPLPPGTPLVRVNFERAFLYAVRHEGTGAILLLGRYLDPHSFV